MSLFKVRLLSVRYILSNDCCFLPSPTVPAPTPSITASRSTGALYAGTTLSLTCDYTLSLSVDTAPQTAVVWMVDGAAVDTSPGRISATGDTLSFSPLATSDTGSYTCELTVTTQQKHVTVQAPQQSAVEDITIQSNELGNFNDTNILQLTLTQMNVFLFIVCYT